MASSREWSVNRRVEEHARLLTLDLFTRYGPFWAHIARLRREFGVVPPCRTPPRIPLDACHLPPTVPPWSRALPEGERWLRPNVLLNDTIVSSPDDGYTGDEYPWDHLSLWIGRLCDLEEQHVPAVCRMEVEGAPGQFWSRYLSACVMYDPPKEALLEFASYAVQSLGATIGTTAPEQDAEDALLFVPPPVRMLHEPWQEQAAARRYHEVVINALHHRLAPIGIDVHKVLWELRFTDPHIRQASATMGRVETRPYIAVEPETTEEDVRAAFRLLSASLSSRPRAGKPARDKMTAVQCAIWYDECGWSHAQLAEHFGWAVQEQAGAKLRSETVRKHVQEGRTILAQRNPVQ